MAAQEMKDLDVATATKVVINDQTVNMTRNALLVAGLEMGKEGDHWPVIKANIHALMRDYEKLKIEKAVQEQLKEHLDQIIGDYEALLERSDDEFRNAMAPHVRGMREVYDAMFAPTGRTETSYDILAEDEDRRYVPWKSSAVIIKSLTEDQK